MKTILLLAEADELPGVTKLIEGARPDAQVIGVSTLRELDAATADPTGLRLVAFCTDVIVPAAVLARLDGPAYNIHPGPPTVRGIYPSVFALYQGFDRYGATLHEIAEEVDFGPITAVKYADIRGGTDRIRLELMARELVTRLISSHAAALVDQDSPLPHIAEAWSGPAWSKRDFDDLCRLPDNITEDEYQRRYRAVGEGPDHALYFEKFGRRFSLTPPAFTGPIVKGGRQVG
ncbi:MAG: formyltransferase family protein [Rhodospirillaceae bacterium]